METVFAEYMDRLEALHTQFEQALDGLPKSALDWTPGPEMNSITVLVVHTTGAERYWIGDVAGQDPSGRVREAEFHVGGLDVAALKERLAASLDYARSSLENLSLADLEAQRTSPRDERVFTVAWALLHALEHTAIHLGHIQLARQLWEQQARSAGVIH